MLELRLSEGLSRQNLLKHPAFQLRIQFKMQVDQEFDMWTWVNLELSLL